MVGAASSRPDVGLGQARLGHFGSASARLPRRPRVVYGAGLADLTS